MEFCLTRSTVPQRHPYCWPVTPCRLNTVIISLMSTKLVSLLPTGDLPFSSLLMSFVYSDFFLNVLLDNSSCRLTSGRRESWLGGQTTEVPAENRPCRNTSRLLKIWRCTELTWVVYLRNHLIVMFSISTLETRREPNSSSESMLWDWTFTRRMIDSVLRFVTITYCYLSYHSGRFPMVWDQKHIFQWQEVRHQAHRQEGQC